MASTKLTAGAVLGAFRFLFLFSIGLQFKFLFATKTVFHPELKYLEFIQEATEFSPAIEYDYVVVGGGTAGCPLAATLSQNYSVLLLERGGVPYSDPNVLRMENLINLLQTYEEDSPAQVFFSEDGIPLARGRVLGGSSMINFGIYSRADDYFYKTSGIEWDMDSVKKAYEWVEESVAHKSNHQNIWNVATRDALLESSIGPDNGNTFDHLVGTKFGGSIFDANGTRHGAVELLKKSNPKNLKVAVHATVDRVIFSRSKTSGLSADSVVYHDTTGKSHQVHISKTGEVILSAGSIGSTQLLLLSGVGPRSYLTSLNISAVHDQQFVGQFMTDNPRNNIAIMIPFPINDTAGPVVGITDEGLYIETISALTPFTSPVSPVFFPDPSPPLNISLGYIASKVATTASTGSLWLNSPTDVSTSPSVQFNYFSKAEDLRICVNGLISISEKMLKSRSMEQFKFEDRSGGKYFKFVGQTIPENTSDITAMESYCRNTLTTMYHYHGGCRVKKVVDGNFKVMGIEALRIVDGSTFVNSPGTNPQASLMMLGRYMGLKIHNERVATA